jgi:geranylgeranyl reductase
MSLSTKVLVVGGGPAGSTAAKILAEHGIEVILIERNLSFRKPCGGGIPYASFDEFGIPKTTIIHHVKSVSIVSPQGRKVKIPLKGGGLAIVDRQQFDMMLRAQAEESGARLSECEFKGMIREKLYSIETKAGSEKSGIRAEYVIAADGIHSRVRAAFGIKPVQSLFVASEHIEGVQSSACEFWFGAAHAPGFYSWVFPAAAGISVGTGTLCPTDLKGLLARFRERRGIQGNGKGQIYNIPIWQGDLFHRGKVLFTGDAAGQVLPFTYEGIYYAMKAGELAARAVIRNKIRDYKRLWRSRFEVRFRLMNSIRRYFLRDDTSAERMVALHTRPEIQDISRSLWLSRDGGRKELAHYLRLFGKFLR